MRHEASCEEERIVNILKWVQQWLQGDEPSSHVAKRRLQLVLVNNRVGMSPDMMDSLRSDIISVVSKYFEINMDTTKIAWERSGESMALVSSIEVKRVRRRLDRPARAESSE